MKAQIDDHGNVYIELTRRNLETLLLKLRDPYSARTLVKSTEDWQNNVFITAVEDQEHYANRAPGFVKELL